MKQKEIILEQLNTMGFEPIELGNVGYAFKYEDLNFLYMPDDNDEQFLRVAIPHLYDVTDENRVTVLEKMHDTGLMLKYSKVCIMYEDAVWAIYEHRLSTSEDLTEILEHIIRVLEVTAQVFHMKINGQDVMFNSDASDDVSDEMLEAELQRMLQSIDDKETCD